MQGIVFFGKPLLALEKKTDICKEGSFTVPSLLWLRSNSKGHIEEKILAKTVKKKLTFALEENGADEGHFLTVELGKVSAEALFS